MRRLARKKSPWNMNIVETVSFVIGAEDTDVINVALQFKDIKGSDLAVPVSVNAYISSNADGSTLVGTGPTVAIGTDGLAIPLIAGKAFMFVPESDGDLDINITKSGAATYYLVVVMPDGRLVISNAITFAA